MPPCTIPAGLVCFVLGQEAVRPGVAFLPRPQRTHQAEESRAARAPSSLPARDPSWRSCLRKEQRGKRSASALHVPGDRHAAGIVELLRHARRDQRVRELAARVEHGHREHGHAADVVAAVDASSRSCARSPPPCARPRWAADSASAARGSAARSRSTVARLNAATSRPVALISAGKRLPTSTCSRNGTCECDSASTTMCSRPPISTPIAVTLHRAREAVEHRLHRRREAVALDHAARERQHAARPGCSAWSRRPSRAPRRPARAGCAGRCWSPCRATARSPSRPSAPAAAQQPQDGDGAGDRGHRADARGRRAARDGRDADAAWRWHTGTVLRYLY